MNIIRRSAGSGVVLLASVVLVSCFAGMIGVWHVKSRMDVLWDKVFDAADNSLAFMNAKLDRIDGAFKSGQTRVGLLSKAVDRLPPRESEAKARVASLLKTLDEELFERLKSAQTWLDSAYAAAVSLGRLSEAVVSSKYADSHQEALGVAMARQLQDVSEAVVGILNTLKEVRQRLADIRDNVASARRIASIIVARLADSEKRLANLCARIETFRARLAEMNGQITAARNSFQWWTTFAAILATALLAWLAVSQISMALHGWSFAKKQPR
jgi:hypothetical protein